MSSEHHLVWYAFLGFCLWLTFRRINAQRDQQILAKRLGCLPAPVLRNRRPLGIDRLEEIFHANTEGRLMEFFLFHARQTGHTLKQCFLMTPAFATIEPANLQAMLSTRCKDWSIEPRRTIALSMLGDGIFTQEGHAWRHSRALLRPQFHQNRYANLALFHQTVNDLIEAIVNEATEAGIVDLHPLFSKFTLDTTTAFLFGESSRILQRPGHGDCFASAFDCAQGYVAKKFRLYPLHWLIDGRGFRDACRKVNNFAGSIAKKSLQRDGESGRTHGFLDSIARVQSDEDAIRGQVINVLAAGRDPTACLLSWTFFLLVRHPDVLRKLKNEVLRNRGMAGICRDDLLNMQYLQKVLKESLRLYPPLPINTRSALRHTILPKGGGPDLQSPVFIPKGTTVAFSLYAMHRRPDLFGVDAEIFRPERWDEDMPMNGDPVSRSWAYIPFHGGPRTCLGMDFAKTQVAFTVFSIIRKFPHLGLPDDEQIEIVGSEKQKITLVIAPAGGCKVQLRTDCGK